MAGLERRHSDGDVLPRLDLHRGYVDQEVDVAIGVIEADQHWLGVVRVRTIIKIS